MITEIDTAPLMLIDEADNLELSARLRCAPSSTRAITRAVTSVAALAGRLAGPLFSLRLRWRRSVP